MKQIFAFLTLLFLLVACQSIAPTVMPTSPAAATVTNTPTILPIPSATLTVEPTATISGPHLSKFVGSFGAGFFSGVFRSPDGKRIFALMNGNELRWYDAKTLHELGTIIFDNLFQPVNVILGFNPDQVVVVGESEVLVISMKSGKVVATMSTSILQYFSGVRFTPDGNKLLYRLTHRSSGPAATSADNSIGLWDIKKDSFASFEENNWLNMSNPVISPDGRWIAAGCSKLIKIWDVESGVVLQTIKGHKDIISSIALSKSGAYLISGDEHGEVFLFDSQSGQILHTFSLKEEIVSLSFFDDDQNVLVKFKYGPDKIIDLTTYLLQTVPAKETEADPFAIELHHQGYIQSSNEYMVINLSQNRQILAVGGQTVLLWDMRTRKLLGSLDNPIKKGLQEIVFTPNGEEIAATTLSGDLLFWSLNKGTNANLAKIVAIGDRYRDYRNGLSFSPDGKMLAVGHGANLELWDVETFKQIGNWQVVSNSKFIYETYFLSDGSSLIITSGSSNDKALVQKWNLKDSKVIRSVTLPVTIDYGVNRVAVFNWQQLAFLNKNKENDWIELQDLETGEAKRLNAHYDIKPVSFDADGKLLFSRKYYQNNVFYIWQVETGKLAYISENFGDNTYDLSLLKTSNFLASLQNGIVYLWDIGEIIRQASQPNITPVALPTDFP